MHALLRRVGLVASTVVVLALVASPAAVADYSTVAAPLTQSVLARSDRGVPLTATAVRSDGWIVVATGRRYDPQTEDVVGGRLFLLPPGGGRPVPFGDPPDRKTNAFGFTNLVVRGDRIFGLTPAPWETSSVGQRAELFELDARTGKVLSSHGWWWFPDLALDPRTGDLVLWSFDCTGECDPRKIPVDQADEELAGTVTHDLVRYDPDARKVTGVLVADAMTAQNDPGGSGTCRARRGSLARCEEVFRTTFSDDGSTLFLATSRAGTNAVDVRDRNGALRYSVPVPRPADDLVFGAPGTCLTGSLLLTSVDGSTWAVPGALDPAAAQRAARQLAAGAPAGVSAAALTPEGNLVTLRRSEALQLSCPDAAPSVSVPPVALPPPAPTAAAAPTAPAAAPPSHPAPPAPSAPPSPSPPNPPPLQPPSLPAVAGPASHATSAMTSVNVGLADTQEEQPVYSLSASRRATSAGPMSSPLLPLTVGAAAVTGMAAVAFVLTVPEPRRARIRLAPSAPTTRGLRSR